MRDKILREIRVWWRPVTCIFIAITMLVHGAIVPITQLITNIDVTTDLTGLSFLVTAIAGAFAVREWGKIKKASEDE